MVTYVYICNACGGPEEERTFERAYPDIETAAAAGMPACPRCGSADNVSRFFGFSIFGPASKSAERDHAALPANFKKFHPGAAQGILSIGMRIDRDELERVKREIAKLAESAGVEIIENRSAEPQPQDEEPVAPEPPPHERDLREEVLGLRPGTTERALFDIRQRRLIEELENGADFGGFFLPMPGESNN